jgi:DNA adenine methylase
MTLEAPFVYFGGKSAIAQQVWAWLGPDVGNYVEPFFGSGAVLLGRPGYDPDRHLETITDKDALVANCWRALQADPSQVARYADWPVNETDLEARHHWLNGEKEGLQARLVADPAYYDAQSAGWWIWGQSCWVGSDWCTGRGPHVRLGGQVVLRPPGYTGPGVYRKRPQLRHAGQGVQKRSRPDLVAWFRDLQQRLRRVRVCYGDWQRILDPTPTTRQGVTAGFFDPPYAKNRRDPTLYPVDADISQEVHAWCLQHGENPLWRIVLCGLGDEHDRLLAHGWQKWTWVTNGGYGLTGQGRGRANRALEACWRSPHCEAGRQMDFPWESAPGTRRSHAPAIPPPLAPNEIRCGQCGTVTRTQRSTKQYCSERCKKAAQRARGVPLSGSTNGL